MAASNVMADFGRMPASRKVLVVAVVALLLGGLYYRLVYASLAEEVDEAKAAYESAVNAHDTAVKSLKRYDELRPVMDKLLEQLARNQAALPTEAEVPAFFETLERKVKESGVEIAKWQKRAEEPIESFVKVPVEIEITGTFMQIKRFFASLVQRGAGGTGTGTGGTGTGGTAEPEERERIVSIESLVISQPQVRNREIILNAKFTAVTFRQDDKAGPGKPGGRPGPQAPPPLRPRAPEPPPGAATPAGARAGAEEALGRGGEARVSDETGAARLEKGI